MTVNNLVEDVLKSIINAQYSAYVHSQQLGEQDGESLFPIPIAEIKEIVLDLQYAYSKPFAKAGETDEYEILPANVYNSLENVYANAFVKAKKALIDDVDMSTASASQNWINMKANLLRGKLDSFVMSEYRKRFLRDTKNIISQNTFNPQTAQDLLVKVIQDIIVNHPDLKTISEQVNPLPSIREALANDLSAQAYFISQQFEGSKTKKLKEQDSTEIIVDSSELGGLPAQSIQHAKIVLDIKSDVNKVT